MSGFAMKAKKEGVTFARQTANHTVSGENRTGIPMQLKERMELSPGLSFDDVRVQYNSVLPTRLDTPAYTQKNQVEVGSGQEHHLPHELGYVVQQKMGNVRANGRHSSDAALNTDPGLEHQADEIGTGRCSPPAQYNAEHGFEEVVQCQFDANALIDGVIGILSQDEFESMRKKLVGLKPRIVVKKVKELLDRNNKLIGNKRREIYQLFFEFYGLNVIRMTPQDMIKIAQDMMIWDINTDYGEVILQDESSFINALNAIYNTKTGAELLTRLAANTTANPNKGVSITIGNSQGGPYIAEKNNTDDEYLGGRRDAATGFVKNIGAGNGADSHIFMHSEALNQIYKKKYNVGLTGDLRAMLAHELIHALHAQMGVKPTVKMLREAPVRGILPTLFNFCQNLFGWSTERKFPEFSEFGGPYGGTPDDVPVTGIRDDFMYPDLLEEIRHINENQIRQELGMDPREKY